MAKFKVSNSDDVGENWTLISCGMDEDGKYYYVTTDHVHASELYQYSQGAKADAELIVKLLNEYYEKLVKI